MQRTESLANDGAAQVDVSLPAVADITGGWICHKPLAERLHWPY
jgi:hypothetical protein